ncbi:hypothetical protein B296_00013816 [Ensete ventricosum]|uniref:Uncharacterized protein n=1 Tax=Ensete ventricosum TaxID=4639 RepID=A0A426YA79_ENSVE|nr:hypothetical protein B296_00013816 [Ensete ventricosum]
MVQGSSPGEYQDSLEDCRGYPKACREYRAKDWTIRSELVGSSLGDSSKGSRNSLGTHREIIGGRPLDSLLEIPEVVGMRE